jgi:hypothetical protein
MTQSLQVDLGYTRRTYLQFDGISKSNLLSISKDFHMPGNSPQIEERKVYPHVTKSAAGKSLADNSSIGCTIPASELPDRAAVADAATNPHQ